jgi:hypothetical protein
MPAQAVHVPPAQAQPPFVTPLMNGGLQLPWPLAPPVPPPQLVQLIPHEACPEEGFHMIWPSDLLVHPLDRPDLQLVLSRVHPYPFDASHVVRTQDPYQNHSGGGGRRSCEEGDNSEPGRQGYECAQERGEHERAHRRKKEHSNRPDEDVRREEAKKSRKAEDSPRVMLSVSPNGKHATTRFSRSVCVLCSCSLSLTPRLVRARRALSPG